MKLLFAYFDFAFDEKQGAFRGLGECGLNFSTTHNYTVVKQKSEQDGSITYSLSCTEKPAEEQIPVGFWGERIYNVTAIVGDNGAGKTTILHSLIKAVVKGLDPGVPFLLALQETRCEKISVYCGFGSTSPTCRFVWNRSDKDALCWEYLDGLQKTKSVLLDNTLSVASLELDRLYSMATPYYLNRFSNDDPPELFIESRKQFINKSLVSSLRFSNSISSREGRSSGSKRIGTVADETLGVIEVHFRYETLQETRFLFDKFQQDNLLLLDKLGHFVPNPRYIIVQVLSVNDLHAIARRILINGTYWPTLNPMTFGGIPRVFSKLQKRGLLGVLIADALFSFYANSFFQNIKNINDFFDGWEDRFVESDDIEEAISFLRRFLERMSLIMDTSTDIQVDSVKENFNSCRSFIEFVLDNANTMLQVFETVYENFYEGISSNQEGQGTFYYRIDVEHTRSDSNKRVCFITFLEKYRKLTDSFYFLIFSSGLSSGEKNMLKMLTQLRYALDGPSVYPDDVVSKDETQNLLRNFFLQERSQQFYSVICDTLFLFLDEADLTYHPEWQRQFVSMLTEILPKMFQEKYDKSIQGGCKDIQVILATHSPLMLGDFPCASTIYLKKNDQGIVEVDRSKRQSSFGQNLYTILRDDFFMTNTIGEFARRKIEEVVKWCGRMSLYCERLKSNGSYITQEERDEMSKGLSVHRATIGLLPPGIIRNKLSHELDYYEIVLTGEDSLDKTSQALLMRKAKLEAKLSEVNHELSLLGGSHASNT